MVSCSIFKFFLGLGKEIGVCHYNKMKIMVWGALSINLFSEFLVISFKVALRVKPFKTKSHRKVLIRKEISSCSFGLCSDRSFLGSFLEDS